jgi:hypothetical protein
MNKTNSSWSEYFNSLVAMANKTEKLLIHKSAKTVYNLYSSSYSVNDVITYIRSNRI